ncbi:MAG: hypothetical protein FWC85_00785 [Elusimicrobia bacterium]|nr:hypothetical protein [Elusimicrobiota bacterium]
MRKLKLSKIEILILAAAALLLSLAAVYNIYKNSLIRLNSEATIIMTQILSAQGEHRTRTGSFVNINAPANGYAPNLKINLTANEFFDTLTAVHSGDIVEVTLTVSNGFFRGSTAFARHYWREKTLFEVNPKTKIPLRHL